jgi:hypothetical protein
MIDPRVVNTAKSVFGDVERSELWIRRTWCRFRQCQVDQLVSDSRLFAFVGWLKAKNGPDAEFWIVNGVAETHLGWSENNYGLLVDAPLKPAGSK